MALHDPVNFSRIVRGMLNIQQHEGELSDYILWSRYQLKWDQVGSPNAEAQPTCILFKAVAVSSHMGNTDPKRL